MDLLTEHAFRSRIEWGMNEFEFDDDNTNSNDFEDEIERDSDEDTEDASETDMVKQEEEYTEIKEQMYQDKLSSLKKQLQQLEEGTHPEYLRRLKKLDQAYQDRIILNEAFQQYDCERVEKEYINEKRAAVREFEEKKIELRENLIAELEEKKRHIEAEKTTIELTGDPLEVKQVTTRKLRRRPNDPPPLPEKRRKTIPEMSYLLDEGDIFDDLKIINKGKLPTSIKKQETRLADIIHEVSTPSSICETKFEDGKLYYDKKWFHRGQPVYVESKELGKCSCTITTIASTEIWLKKNDGSKIRIYLYQLQKGKVLLRKRST